MTGAYRKRWLQAAGNTGTLDGPQQPVHPPERRGPELNLRAGKPALRSGQAGFPRMIEFQMDPQSQTPSRPHKVSERSRCQTVQFERGGGHPVWASVFPKPQ